MLEKKFPALIGILIIISGIFGAVALTKSQTGFVGKAIQPPEIKELKISNVSDSGFTVSWLTDIEFAQFIVVPESSKKTFCQPESGMTQGSCYYDERDAEKHVPVKRKTHYVNVDSLSPSKNYSIKIYTSGLSGELAGRNATTGTVISGNPSISSPVYGKFFINDEKTPADGALVYLNSEKGATLSALIKHSGEWLITLTKLRNKSLDNYLKLNDSETFDLAAVFDSTKKTDIKASVVSSQPLPDVTIGSVEKLDFTFAAAGNFPPAPKTAAPSQKKSGFAVATPGFFGESVPASIINPSQNSAVDDLPTFRGTADPGQTVTIEINSETPTTATVRADDSGNWFWTPPANLLPGEHTVTITVIDKNGNRQVVTRTFTVLAGANTLPVTAGSESAILATPTPEITALPTPTVNPTIFPTLVPTPRAGSQEIPVTAAGGPFVIALTSGVVFATMGLWLFFREKRIV